MNVVEFSADSWQASSPGLREGLDRRIEVLAELAQGLEALAGSNQISGVGADAMRAYIREVQLPVAQSLLVAVSTFQTAIGVYWAGYAQVDTHGDFRLVADEFDAHLTQLDTGLGRLRGFEGELTRISAGAAHLVSLGGAGARAAGAVVEDFEGMRAIARTQKETWEAYEASDPGFNQVRELIAELKGVLKNLGSLTVGRGRSYTAGSFDLTLARLGELTTGMFEYCQANQQVASEGWQDMFDKYAQDVEAARREQALTDLIWDGLQILTGAVVTVIGLGLTPFTAGFSPGLTAIGGTLLVGGINNAVNHVSIAATGNELDLAGMAGRWWDANVARPVADWGGGWQYVVGFLSGAGHAVTGMAQLNVHEIGVGVTALATDQAARDALWQQVSGFVGRVADGDKFAIGQVAGELAGLIIPGAAAAKIAREGGLPGKLGGRADGLVKQPKLPDVEKVTTAPDRAGTAPGSPVSREALNGIPGVSVVGDSVYVNGVEKMTISEWEAIRKASVHNTSAPEATLGKWEGPASENSYTNRAIDTGTQYFDLGEDWSAIRSRHGLSEDEMFDLFNRPFLDDLIRDNKPVRFTHNPEEDAGALGREMKYLEFRDYFYDPNTMTARR